MKRQFTEGKIITPGTLVVFETSLCTAQLVRLQIWSRSRGERGPCLSVMNLTHGTPRFEMLIDEQCLTTGHGNQLLLEP